MTRKYNLYFVKKNQTIKLQEINMLVKQDGPFRTVLNEHFLSSSSSSSPSPTPLPSLSPSFSSFFTSFVYSLSLFFPFWLYWVFVALCGLSLVAVSWLLCRGSAWESSFQPLLFVGEHVLLAHGFSSCGSGA